MHFFLLDSSDSNQCTIWTLSGLMKRKCFMRVCRSWNSFFFFFFMPKAVIFIYVHRSGHAPWKITANPLCLGQGIFLCWLILEKLVCSSVPALETQTHKQGTKVTFSIRRKEAFKRVLGLFVFLHPFWASSVVNREFLVYLRVLKLFEPAVRFKHSFKHL